MVLCLDSVFPAPPPAQLPCVVLTRHKFQGEFDRLGKLFRLSCPQLFLRTKTLLGSQSFQDSVQMRLMLPRACYYVAPCLRVLFSFSFENFLCLSAAYNAQYIERFNRLFPSNWTRVSCLINLWSSALPWQLGGKTSGCRAIFLIFSHMINYSLKYNDLDDIIVFINVSEMS